MSSLNSKTQDSQASLASQINELSSQPSLKTEVDMLKVLDNYKKGVDFFNSYGIEKRAKTSHANNRQSKLSEASTFWDYI